MSWSQRAGLTGCFAAVALLSACSGGADAPTWPPTAEVMVGMIQAYGDAKRAGGDPGAIACVEDPSRLSGQDGVTFADGSPGYSRELVEALVKQGRMDRVEAPSGTPGVRSGALVGGAWVYREAFASKNVPAFVFHQPDKDEERICLRRYENLRWFRPIDSGRLLKSLSPEVTTVLCNASSKMDYKLGSGFELRRPKRMKLSKHLTQCLDVLTEAGLLERMPTTQRCDLGQPSRCHLWNDIHLWKPTRPDTWYVGTLEKRGYGLLETGPALPCIKAHDLHVRSLVPLEPPQGYADVTFEMVMRPEGPGTVMIKGCPKTTLAPTWLLGGVKLPWGNQALGGRLTLKHTVRITKDGEATYPIRVKPRRRGERVKKAGAGGVVGGVEPEEPELELNTAADNEAPGTAQPPGTPAPVAAVTPAAPAAVPTPAATACPPQARCPENYGRLEDLMGRFCAGTFGDAEFNQLRTLRRTKKLTAVDLKYVYNLVGGMTAHRFKKATYLNDFYYGPGAAAWLPKACSERINGRKNKVPRATRKMMIRVRDLWKQTRKL